MIKQLYHKNIDVAEQIKAVFQVSYIVEAQLLGAVGFFPPLKRKVNDFINSETLFYGYWADDSLAAVVEVKTDAKLTHIQSLVVDPAFFRRGIASQLIHFVFETFPTPMHMVETGLDNGPATKLYLKHGFKKVKVYDTEIGIKKIRFERKSDF